MSICLCLKRQVKAKHFESCEPKNILDRHISNNNRSFIVEHLKPQTQYTRTGNYNTGKYIYSKYVVKAERRVFSVSHSLKKGQGSGQKKGTFDA